jgi:hypothetical protein
MEALLIEELEPPHNRRRGDDFRAVEYLQAEDPELERRRLSNLLDEISSRLSLRGLSALKRAHWPKRSLRRLGASRRRDA